MPKRGYMRKDRKPFRVFFLLPILYLLLGWGCSSAPVMSDSSSLPPIVRLHKRFSPPIGPALKAIETGIYAQKGEIISVLPAAHESVATYIRIGNQDLSFSYHTKAHSSGPVTFGIHLSGQQLRVFDILVWRREDWVQIVDVLEKRRREDLGNRHVIAAIAEAKNVKRSSSLKRKSLKTWMR